MVSDQRLSVTFGAFSCDVVGYDDPFTILTRVVELFGEIAKSNPAFGAGKVPMSDMERAKLAAGLSDQASRIDELADQSAPNGMRYVVSNADADAADIEDEAESESEVVIAAQPDEAAGGGDLELLDTLEADGSTETVAEEEVVALDITPDAALVLQEEPAETAPEIEEPAPEAPLELTELLETPVIVEAEADIDTPEVAVADEPLIVETVAEAEETPVELEAADTPDLDVEEFEIVETTIGSDTKSAAEIAATALASLSEVKAEEPPARQPLRLNLGNYGAEGSENEDPEIEAKDAPATDQETEIEADKADAEPQKPQPRVTITKLPLRPKEPKPIARAEANLRHALSPVQKVEPVVTLNTTIGDGSDEAAKQSRAERIRAKLEQRDVKDEDDGENFLFSDVNENPQEGASIELGADTGAAETVAEDTSPLFLEPSAPEASEQLEEAAKKPRRSIANLLGFGKSSTDAPEPVQEIPTLKAEVKPLADDKYDGDTDGFDRLRESVAAAMPAPDEPTISYPAAKLQPETISEAIDYDDETSPTAFARRVGANSLQDLLEASAVYMDVVEGKSRFSRRDVMQALNQIGTDNDYTQEARLKSFRKLLTTGSLVRVDDGMFTVSQSTRFGYETRLQA